jgi:signal transduction histidine kinase
MAFDREGRRTSFVVVLLVAVFLVTAFMAVRAQLSARYHRVTAENVIRDWTRVAADELARRAESQSGFFGTYPVLQVIAGMSSLPTHASLAAAVKTDDGKRNARLVVAAFSFDGVLTSPELSDDARAWLRPQLAAILATPPAPADRKPLHAMLGGKQRSFVYLVPSDHKRVVGFEVNRDALVAFFPSVLETRPLMPPSLANGRITNDALAVRVRGDGGRVLFTTPRVVDAANAVRLRIEEGLLRGYVVELSIAPDVAPLLVFGGIPRLLPTYTIALVLTGVLLSIAVMQLRKERALARMRSEFIAGVSHELRTPLTQIRMFAETLLLDRVRSEEERRRSLTIIDQETRRLAQLVENVLQFSRGERGTLSITRREADVAALVRGTIETVLPIAKGRGVSIDVDAGGELVANVDDDAIRQIVLNLLDNAVKYGPDGQRVRVDVARIGGVPSPGLRPPSPAAAGEGFIRIAVDDEGPGVPANDRARVWRRYERLERERARAIAGAGIGLAVVRELVALHGGRTRVEEGSRGGARFIVEVPS